MDWIEGAKLLGAAILGGGAAKVIESMSTAMKMRGDHRLSLVDQLDRLRSEAVEERGRALGELETLRSTLSEFRQRLEHEELESRRLAAELENSREAERRCQERLSQLTDQVNERLLLGNTKFAELETRLKQLESPPRRLSGKGGVNG